MGVNTGRLCALVFAAVFAYVAMEVFAFSLVELTWSIFHGVLSLVFLAMFLVTSPRMRKKQFSQRIFEIAGRVLRGSCVVFGIFLVGFALIAIIRCLLLARMGTDIADFVKAAIKVLALGGGIAYIGTLVSRVFCFEALTEYDYF